jgi:flagellar biosynthesis protein FliQ
MEAEIYIYLLQKALILLLLFSALPVMASLFTGFFVSLFQSVTQIQEPTLSYVPKFLAVSLSLVLTGPFIARELVSFYNLLLTYITQIR